MKREKESRKKILDLSIEGGGVHLAPALSCIDILTTLYYDIMTENDRFILSKGHACLALYTVLQEKGFNPDIHKGHPDIDIKNGIECTTGSLGHGLPIAIGMAWAKKIKKEKGNIYVVISDGELQEGTTWESLLIASHHKLDNLVVIIDYNKLQALNLIEDVLSVDNLFNKITAFNCDCREVFDGHNINDLKKAINKKSIYEEPIVIIAHTIKGKGVSYMEGKSEWHARRPSDEEFSRAYKELKCN